MNDNILIFPITSQKSKDELLLKEVNKFIENYIKDYHDRELIPAPKEVSVFISSFDFGDEVIPFNFELSYEK